MTVEFHDFHFGAGEYAVVPLNAMMIRTICVAFRSIMCKIKLLTDSI